MFHLLDLTELTKEEALYILDLTDELKSKDRESLLGYCRGYRAALIFEKPSTRTRVSLQAAIESLGASAIVLSSSEMQLSRGEDVKDTARVLSRYVDAVSARVFSHKMLAEFAEFSTVPVINALSDLHHPLQAIADVYTLYKHLDRLDFILAYIGDGNNVCNSLITAAALYGFKIRVATPPAYMPDSRVVEKARSICSNCFEWFEDPYEAVRGADAIYTDTWVSMGDEEEKTERLAVLRSYQVKSELVKASGKDSLFMHCLPAHKGEEVTEEVFESESSIVFEQAENRMHTSRAIFFYLWRKVIL